jgi:hypothetical protein
MRTIDNEEVTFETIEDHLYKSDRPDELKLNPEMEPIDSAEFLANAFMLARPILLAMIATPLIPEGWQKVVDTLVRALDGVAADAKESASEWEEDLPVC